MQKPEIETKLKTIFHSLFNVELEKITAESSPDNIERWESMQHLALVTSIEEEFGIALNEQDIVEMLNFGLTLEIVSSAVNGNHA